MTDIDFRALREAPALPGLCGPLQVPADPGRGGHNLGLADG